MRSFSSAPCFLIQVSDNELILSPPHILTETSVSHFSLCYLLLFMGQSAENSKATMAASAIFVGLGVIAVVLRFYARTRVKAGIASDDWWILAGLLLTLITGGLLLYGKQA